MQPPSPASSSENDMEMGRLNPQRTPKLRPGNISTDFLDLPKDPSTGRTIIPDRLLFHEKTVKERFVVYGRKMVGLRGNYLKEFGWRRGLIGAIGSFLVIFVVSSLHYFWLRKDDYIFLSASIAASAVLINFWPESPPSQPQACILGNVLSALVGVAFAKLARAVTMSITRVLFAALAVFVSSIVMIITRTFHPPAAATALMGYLGSRAITEVGFLFVLMPVASSISVTVLVSVLYLNLFEGIVYPRYWLA